MNEANQIAHSWDINPERYIHLNCYHAYYTGKPALLLVHVSQ